ncbi:putative lipid-transfer protein DIR1 [Citrus sinensis]|uniref:Lipid-transfer protein DIR1 n=1 Tax=Citrus sinensis TaxID=2711 RepID=A0ACB8P1S2_CITSI|nr:putative lipid-transfer protein DIR1 [Citrus sinensis]
MAKPDSRVLVQRVVAFLFIASSVNGGAMAISICNIESSKMNLCLPAVSGKSPTQPTEQCCAVVSGAKLSCLCSYKNLLPAFGINPKYALALPKKCGLETPPQCRGQLYVKYSSPQRFGYLDIFDPASTGAFKKNDIIMAY